MLLYVRSSIAIILMGKRELVALLNLSSWCLVMVERLFLAVPRGCLQFVIVVFPDHTPLLFLGRVLRGPSWCWAKLSVNSVNRHLNNNGKIVIYLREYLQQHLESLQMKFQTVYKVILIMNVVVDKLSHSFQNGTGVSMTYSIL